MSVVTPVLVLFDPSNGNVLTNRTVGGPAENIGAEFCITTFSCPDMLTDPQTITFVISSDTTGGETVTPLSITPVPAGSFSTSQIQPAVSITLSSPKQAGKYTLTATDTGVATDATPVTVTVTVP